MAQAPGNYYPSYSLRVHEDLLAKVKVIAAFNRTSLNKQLERIILEYVTSYEKENGEIKLSPP